MPVLPEAKSLYVSQPLTTVSTAYAQAGNWIAPQVFPTVPVQRQGDLYWHYPQGDWKRIEARLRAPATETPGGGWTMDSDNYFCHVYGIHKDVDDQTQTNAATGGFNLYADATRWVTEQLLLKRDRLWVDTYLRDGVWTGGTGTNGGTEGVDITGGASNTTTANEVISWHHEAADPVADIQRQILGSVRRTGFRPNVLVLGPAVYSALLQSASILERIKYSERGIVSEDLLRAVFNVDRLVVTWTTENFGNQGGADNIQPMNNRSALLVYAAPSAGLQTLSGGYTFTWNGLLGSGAFGTRVKRWRMEEIASDRIEGEMAFDMKVVSPDVGVFFKNVVA